MNRELFIGRLRSAGADLPMVTSAGGHYFTADIFNRRRRGHSVVSSLRSRADPDDPSECALASGAERKGVEAHGETTGKSSGPPQQEAAGCPNQATTAVSGHEDPHRLEWRDDRRIRRCRPASGGAEVYGNSREGSAVALWRNASMGSAARPLESAHSRISGRTSVKNASLRQVSASTNAHLAWRAASFS